MLGILDRDEGVALRATFIVDPEGVIRFVSVNDRDTGRSAEEVLRSLAAMQSGGLTAWSGDPGTRRPSRRDGRHRRRG